MLALAIVVVAGTQWTTEAEANDRRASAVLTPQSVAPGTPTKFTLTVTVTSGDRAGTVIVFIPNEFTAVGSATIVSTPVNKPWTLHTCSAVGDDDADGADICATANVDQDDTLLVGDSIVFSITATTPASGGSFPWRVQPMQGNDFNGPAFEPAHAPFSNPTHTPTNTPTHTPTHTPTNTPTNTPTHTPTHTPTGTPPLGRIIICKDTNPSSSGISFDFDTDIPGMIDPDLEHGECDKQGGLDTRQYEIIENLVAGWVLDDIDCIGIGSGNIHVDLASETVIIDLKPGEEVECTFTNEPSDTPTPTPTGTPPTPTATPTDTPTSTPTNTPPNTPTNTPPPEDPCKSFAMGDVNGPKAKPGDERTVNSIDAALILQFDARLINSLNCPENADVDLDGRIDPRDALLILQFVARLISHLPV